MDLKILKGFMKKPLLNLKVQSTVLDDLNVVSALYARNIEPLEESPCKLSMEESEPIWNIQATRIDDQRRKTLKGVN